MWSVTPAKTCARWPCAKELSCMALRASSAIAAAAANASPALSRLSAKVPPGSLSPRTGVEERKLQRRPEGWRLACQALVQQSLLVLTRPQVGLADAEALLAAARQDPLPAGPMAWPVVEPAPGEEEEVPGDEADHQGPA